MYRIILMQALFALTFPLGKLGLQYMSPLVLTGIRMLIAGAIMLLYSWYKKRPMAIPRADWWLFAKTSVFYVYLAFVPELWALEHMSSLKNNMLWSSFPFVSALLSYFLLAERLTAKQWFGMVVGLAGMVPIILVNNTQEFAAQGFACGEFLYVSWPEVMMAVAVTSTAYAWFLIKDLMHKGYSLTLINGVCMFIGGALSLLTRLLLFDTVTPWYTDFGAALFYALCLVVVSNIIGYSLYGYLTHHYSLTFLSLSGFLCPLFGMLFAKLFFNEQIPALYLGATLCIGLGLFLFYKDELGTKVNPGS